jgi:hypothetical protein
MNTTRGSLAYVYSIGALWVCECLFASIESADVLMSSYVCLCGCMYACAYVYACVSVLVSSDIRVSTVLDVYTYLSRIYGICR